MKMKQAILGALSLVASVAASATTLNFEQFDLTFDETTAFGAPTITTGPGNALTFGWSLGHAVNYLNVGPSSDVEATVILPSYTINAKAGFTLSGPVHGFIGELIYSDFRGNVTNMALIGDMSVNGGTPISVNLDFVKTPIILVPDLANVGTMSLDATAGLGDFTSLGFAGKLFMTSSGAPGQSLAAIQSRETDVFTVSFFATPVPVPPAAWLFSSALLGLVLRRRSAA
jgi:hypothetical protein